MGGVYLTWAADAARDAVRGTPYRVIELPGWLTRGHGGYRVVEGIVGHHTGGPKTGDYPSLNIVRDGRSDLPGPLCTYGLARSGDIIVVAAGVAWHAGASAYAGFADLNDEFGGIEAESSGGGDWTPAQRDCYPRLVGSFLRRINRPAERYCSHRTCAKPPGRKPDPTGLDDAWMIAAARAWMNGAPAPAAPPPAPSGGGASLPTLTAGMRNSPAVAALQRFLNAYNWRPTLPLLPVTGNYLDQTVAVVKAAQAQMGVTGPDAVGTPCGPRTNAGLWARGFRG